MVRIQKVESFYAKLRESATSLSSQNPLLIFPSTSDVDSLCALKVITHILESDSIQYSCFPVSSFLEIHKYAGPAGLCSTSSESPPVTILLINWGCHRDLKVVLKLGPAARVFVVDSHRPIHLHNLSDQNQQVVVLHTDDDERQADLAYDFDVLKLANESFQLHMERAEEAGESHEDEDEEEEEEEEEGSDDGDDGDGDRPSKRRKMEDGVKVFKKLKRDYYKMGTFHGKPSGCLLFELSHMLRKNTNELLWLACVSLTDQFVHERLTDERYQAAVMELEQHINSSGNIDKITSVTLKDGTKIRAPDCSRISYEEEPRLMLLREWTLFDSMLCSSYIATKLKTWSDNGIKKLKLLLARMGFALIECQQKFPYMSLEVKKKMKQEFDRFLPEYGLNDFYYRSFLRLHGYSSRVSAADVVYGITALLESFLGSGGSSASKQFGEAYDALSLNNLDKLRSGMQQAIKVQRAILRQGSAAIMKSGCIRSGRKFRWVKVEDSMDAKYLGYPQALTKFCYFLMDALREKGARMKPMLCACASQQPGKILVVGVCGKPRLGAVRGNAFGNAFRKAAQESRADYFHELFESSWIVLDSSAVNSFMIRLTEML
ncbi:PREDICTED: cell division control protein 45 homolog [Camelina sativa]|uniref:Cell division control protein 45 homolog n=1 Tax=Camelina sativa TaxID=90675 RepID=A0ABM0XNQ3_CAMSA|nr:PREDICTED: cell division control protein 45 homolog [Camelina sativa]